MYFSYFSNGLRVDTHNKSAELRVYSEKIASRAFSNIADFTLGTSKDNPLEIRKGHYAIKDESTYTTEVINYLINTPYLTKIYLVIRNPKDRLLSGLAQILFRNTNFNFEEAAYFLKENIDNEHISFHCTEIYHMITHKKNSLLKSRYSEVFTIEDLDDTEYIETFYGNLSHDNFNVTNKPLYKKVEDFIKFINEDNRFVLLSNQLNEYLRQEIESYNYLKEIKYL